MEKISNIVMSIWIGFMLLLTISGCREKSKNGNVKENSEPQPDFILLNADGDTVRVWKGVEDYGRSYNTVYFNHEGKTYVVNGGIQILELEKF